MHIQEKTSFRALSDNRPTHLQESLVQGILSDVQHLRAVNAAIVIDLLDDQPVGKGRDVQHVEQRGLAGTHLISRLNQLHITLERKGGKKQFIYIRYKLQEIQYTSKSKSCLTQFTRISMVPLEILVVIPKAWKKEVFSGPSPVF